MKVLVFTSAFSRRSTMMRQSMLGVLNQSYPDVVHTVNITLKEPYQTMDYSPLYDDLLNENLVISYNISKHSHQNNMIAIKAVNYEAFDLFIKMDDDDIYKRDYVANIVKCFEENNCDIVSTRITNQLNGYNIYPASYKNLGNLPEEEDYNMPMTYAFNKKALDAIINLREDEIFGYDDMMWRKAWVKAGLVAKTVLNDDQIVWNIHGGNESTGNFLRK